MADLLAESANEQIPTGEKIKILDVGVGANLIYPLLGYAEYKWSFVGTDIDKTAINAAQQIIEKNRLQSHIQVRLQTNKHQVFSDDILGDDYFSLSMCNPPFFNSAAQAQLQNQRKWKNLGKTSQQRNFGGQSHELWCEGGESAFTSRMIEQSHHVRHQIGWFTTLVSRESNLPPIYQQLKSIGAQQVRTMNMAQGQKKSRCVAWRF